MTRRWTERGEGFDQPFLRLTYAEHCALIDGRLSADVGTSRDPAAQQGYTDLVTIEDRSRLHTSKGVSGG